MKLLIFVGIVMFILGFYTGVAYTINRVVDVAVQFIDIDREVVDAALFQYHAKLGGTYNAPILNDTRDKALR